MYLSVSAKPSFPTRYKDAPVQTQSLAIFPVFAGISGSYKTTLILAKILTLHLLLNFITNTNSFLKQLFFKKLNKKFLGQFLQHNRRFPYPSISLCASLITGSPRITQKAIANTAVQYATVQRISACAIPGIFAVTIRTKARTLATA